MKRILSNITLRLFGHDPFRTPQDIKPVGLKTTQDSIAADANEFYANIYQQLNRKR